MTEITADIPGRYRPSDEPAGQVEFRFPASICEQAAVLSTNAREWSRIQDLNSIVSTASVPQ
jgi:hypothetical protein